jgi:urate oxidase
MGISLGANQYGKAENRVVRIYRDTSRHEIVDLNVSTSLRGDFGAAHTDGDQADVLPTDTQKNTAFAYAKEHGVSSPEDYAIALGRHFLDAVPKADSAQIRVEQYAWDRIPVGSAGDDSAPAGHDSASAGHDSAFVRRGGAVRTTVVTVSGRGDAQHIWVVSGLQDLVLLKSTGSEFKGFLKDKYTTLQETDDRILATSLVARWRYQSASGVDWNKSYDAIQAALLETFANTYSRALQETLYVMGKQVLEANEHVAELRFAAPNKHHFLVDLSPFGLENDGEVFIAADRPYGLIEAAVARDDAADAGDAWLALPSFI